MNGDPEEAGTSLAAQPEPDRRAEIAIAMIRDEAQGLRLAARSGMTESEARQKLGSVKVYSSDFRPMKNVLAGRTERALYKMVCDGDSERVVGIHMIGPDAPEILQAAAVCVKAGLTKAQFDATVALHPTMAEELVLLR